jgi:hypothetical protein
MRASWQETIGAGLSSSVAGRVLSPPAKLDGYNLFNPLLSGSTFQ